MSAKIQRFMRGFCVSVVIVLLINNVLTADEKKSENKPKVEFEIRNIEGWGTFSQNRYGNTQTESIELKWGKLRLKTLAFDLPDDCKAGNVSVKCTGKTIKVGFEMKDSRVVVHLCNDVIIRPDQTMNVVITFRRN